MDIAKLKMTLEQENKMMTSGNYADVHILDEINMRSART
jgi:hypothetical protein